MFFSAYTPATGFELWLYSMDGVVRGPYTGRGPGDRGDFWSHTVAGPDAVLQNVFMRLATEWEGFAAVPSRYVCEGDTVKANQVLAVVE